MNIKFKKIIFFIVFIITSISLNLNSSDDNFQKSCLPLKNKILLKKNIVNTIKEQKDLILETQNNVTLDPVCKLNIITQAEEIIKGLEYLKRELCS